MLLYVVIRRGEAVSSQSPSITENAKKTNMPAVPRKLHRPNAVITEDVVAAINDDGYHPVFTQCSLIRLVRNRRKPPPAYYRQCISMAYAVIRERSLFILRTAVYSTQEHDNNRGRLFGNITNEIGYSSWNNYYSRQLQLLLLLQPGGAVITKTKEKYSRAPLSASLSHHQ